MASLQSLSGSGVLVQRSLSGHHTARRSVPATSSLARATFKSFSTSSKQTSGNRSWRPRNQRPASSSVPQSQGRKVSFGHNRFGTLRRRRVSTLKWPCLTGSRNFCVEMAGEGRHPSSRRSIAWGASLLWRNVISEERRVTSVRASSLQRVGLQVTARLFGPAIFESTKLRTLFLGIGQEQHPTENGEGRRTYTLTHSDVTSKLTLAVAREFNKAQFGGWYSRLQRDEILAVWRVAKISGTDTEGRDGEDEETRMELHVHCHISGGHVLLNFIARLRFWIFRKELPVVLEAFRHGDRVLFEKHPALEYAPVWVHFHSTCKELHQRECWGPLIHAAQVGAAATDEAVEAVIKEMEDSLARGEDSWPADVAPKVRGAQLIPTPVFLQNTTEKISVHQ